MATRNARLRAVEIAAARHPPISCCWFNHRGATSMSTYGPVRPQRGRSHRLDEIRLRRVLDYIAQHLDEHITVAQLAGVACLSPFHFARMFKAAVGMAPHRYVSHQRLEIAMVLLAAGQRSLSDIALSCQFSSQASFHRAFRRATGVTPGEYRRASPESRKPSAATCADAVK